MNPFAMILLFSSAAVLAAPLGVLPLASSRRTPVRWIGWANALAAGFMLGNAVVLGEAGLAYRPISGALGALFGIGLVAATHRVSGTAELDLNRLDETPAGYSDKILRVDTFHGAVEGVAIGVAMHQSLALGAVVALTMGVHNVPEATALGAVLKAKGVPLWKAAGLAVATNLGQIVLAIVTYAAIAEMPSVLPGILGFAVGALVFLVMSELLPQSYEQAGKVGVALAASVAMGTVVLLGGLVP